MAQYHLQQQYVLRSIDFSYEKCTLVNSNNEEQRMTVKELWDNTAIIMTDSVKKNLLIEKKMVLQLVWVQVTFLYTFCVKTTHLRHWID